MQHGENMHITKIERFLESLPTGVTLVLRAGPDRRTEKTITKWTDIDIDNIVSVCEDVLTLEEQGRLIAYKDNKQIKSIGIQSDITQSQTVTQNHLDILVQGLIRMSEEQRRFLGAITESFTVMHETVQEVIQKERIHHEELTETQLALALAEQEHEQNQSTTGDKALEILSSIVQSKTNKFDLKQYIVNNPDVIDSLLKDDEIVSLVTEKMIK